ncbi:hypothetical protein LTR16_008121, partial [Cryomyces antarcticus]
ILDDDGDLVGRVELTPEKARELQEEADAEEDGEQGPGLEILNGLSVSQDGNLYDDDGDAVGQLTEGDPADLEGLTCNENGEIVDDEGNVVGRAQLHPDIGELTKFQHEAEVERPGVDTLEGLEVNSQGDILNEEGEAVGKLVEGDAEELKGKKFNDEGEIVDDEGNILGKAEVAQIAKEAAQDAAEGAADDVAGQAGDAAEGAADNIQEKAEDAIDEVKDAGQEAAQNVEDAVPGVEALEGMDINSQGQVVDEEGNVLAKLADGDLQEKIDSGEVDTAGMHINEE